MPTDEERLARIEAALQHVVTREDVQGLRDGLVRWMVGTGIGVAGVAATLVAVLMRFLAE